MSVARILIAEHDREVSSSLARRLHDSGFATCIADNSDDAQKLGLTETFDLLILDLGLPEQDGFTSSRSSVREARGRP